MGLVRCGCPPRAVATTDQGPEAAPAVNAFGNPPACAVEAIGGELPDAQTAHLGQQRPRRGYRRSMTHVIGAAMALNQTATDIFVLADGTRPVE